MAKDEAENLVPLRRALLVQFSQGNFIYDFYINDQQSVQIFGLATPTRRSLRCVIDVKLLNSSKCDVRLCVCEGHFDSSSSFACSYTHIDNARERERVQQKVLRQLKVDGRAKTALKAKFSNIAHSRCRTC